MTEDDDKMSHTDDFEDMSEDEFDAEFSAGEPAELVFDQRIRVFGVSSALLDVGQTGNPTRRTASMRQHGMVLTHTNG